MLLLLASLSHASPDCDETQYLLTLATMSGKMSVESRRVCVPNSSNSWKSAMLIYIHIMFQSNIPKGADKITTPSVAKRRL